MKILQVIDSLAMGGAEKLLLDSIPLYVKKGIEMDIALLHDNNYSFTEELEKQKCCSISKLSKGTVYNPLLIFKLAKIINNYDVVHVHLFPAQYWVVLAKIIARSKVKLIYTEHNSTNRRVSNPLIASINKLIYKLYDKVVAISDPVKELLLEKINVSSNQLEFVYNGVDIKKYKEAIALPKECFFDKKSIILIQVSSFTPQKDQKTLIKAMAHLSNNYCLLLVGVGELFEECKNLVENLELNNRVQFLEKRNDVPALLKTSDIVVLSSNYEGLSLSSIEGMASGKPFLASAVPGLKEIVKNYGILFPQGDDIKLAEEIIKLENKEYSNEVVLKCQQRAKQFDIDKMINAYIVLYNSL